MNIYLNKIITVSNPSGNSHCAVRQAEIRLGLYKTFYCTKRNIEEICNFVLVIRKWVNQIAKF